MYMWSCKETSKSLQHNGFEAFAVLRKTGISALFFARERAKNPAVAAMVEGDTLE